MRVLDDRGAASVRSVCERARSRLGSHLAEVYIDALLARMDDGDVRRPSRRSTSSRPPPPPAPRRSAAHFLTPEFVLVRALAVEAFYSDFVAPGAPARARGRRSTSARRLRRSSARTGPTWGWGLRWPSTSMSWSSARARAVACRRRARRERALGAAAGDGPAPHRVRPHALGGPRQPRDLVPGRVRGAAGADQPPVPLLRGRCVGGTTTVNTKVAVRPERLDYEKWHAAAGTGRAIPGEPFGEADLLPALERVERRLGVRRRPDWQRCVTAVAPGFEAVGTSSTPVDVVHGSELLADRIVHAGLSDERGQVDAEHLHRAGHRSSTVSSCGRAARSQRVLIEERAGRPQATGVEYVDADGQSTRSTPTSSSSRRARWARPGSCCAPACARSRANRRAAGRSAATSGFTRRGSSPACSRSGWTPTWSIRSAPTASTGSTTIDGGYLVEASTVQDPIGFATGLCDENGLPMWGAGPRSMSRALPAISRACCR